MTPKRPRKSAEAERRRRFAQDIHRAELNNRHRAFTRPSIRQLVAARLWERVR